jgi:hypothetical protein
MRSGMLVRSGVVAIAAVSVVLGGVFSAPDVASGGGFAQPPVRVKTFRIGPWDLAPINQPGWEVRGNNELPHPKGNVAIKGIKFHVTNAHGHHVGLHQVHLHHIVAIDQSQPDAVCGNEGTRARFAGTGAERTPLKLDRKFRYRVDEGDVWGSTFHIHTTSSQPANDVFIEYTIKYQRITPDSNFKYTTPYFLDVTGCWSNSGSLYDVPGGGLPGSEDIAERTYTALRDGRAVFAGGHIHAGGIDISLTRDATGTNVCTAEAEHNGQMVHPFHPVFGQLVDISYCMLNEKVTAGEKFTLRSKYDHQYETLKAMGIMLVHIYEPA